MTDAETIAELREQLKQSKAQNLTPEEAALLCELESDAAEFFDKALVKSAFAKLRSLSFPETPPENEGQKHEG